MAIIGTLPEENGHSRKYTNELEPMEGNVTHAEGALLHEHEDVKGDSEERPT